LQSLRGHAASANGCVQVSVGITCALKIRRRTAFFGQSSRCLPLPLWWPYRHILCGAGDEQITMVIA
jgi:hypothetical protein